MSSCIICYTFLAYTFNLNRHQKELPTQSNLDIVTTNIMVHKHTFTISLLFTLKHHNHLYVLLEIVNIVNCIGTEVVS